MRWPALASAALIALVFALPATATERRPPSTAQQAQQAKMRSCSTQAAGQQLRGAPRRDFMKTCLSGRAVAS